MESSTPQSLNEVCYLCGKEIADDDRKSDDHVIPQLLVTRKQPKTKGFDYGGKLPAHEICNNEFGSETYCATALKLINKLYNINCVSMLNDKKVMVLNEDCFKNLSQRDLHFFRIIDVRAKSIIDIKKPSFFEGKPKTNPKRDALFVALAVLTKSAAALLIKRHLHFVPSRWSVLAIHHTEVSEEMDTSFDSIFGVTTPFDIGVKVWLRHFDSDNWLAAYRVQNVLIFLLFRFSETETFWNGMIERFPNKEHWFFEGTHLNELINYQWQKPAYKNA